MKKAKYFLLLIIIVMGTTYVIRKFSTSKEETEEVEKYEMVRFESFCNDFMARHENMMNNSVMHKKMNEVFKREITDSLKKSSWLMEDYPVMFMNIRECGENEYIVHFQSYQTRNYINRGKFHPVDAYYDIISIVDSTQIEELVEYDFYNVYGRLIRFLNTEEYKEYTYDGSFSDAIGIWEPSGLASKKMYLGRMFFEIDSLKHYEI